MKKQTNTNLLIGTSFALTLAIASWLPTAATAKDEAKKPMKGDGHQMMQGCQAMKGQKKKMKEDMKAQDAKLTELVAKMNSAPQDKKTNLMAAVLTQMLEQRIAMDARKAKMQEEMMQHMMKHMQMGKESMAQCPMMKGMKGMDKKAADVHTEHKAKKTDTLEVDDHKGHKTEKK
jgi:hypothetical protein